jgi:hypothetical protein
MKFFALFAFLVFAAVMPAHAQGTDARAQILKGQLEGFLENQKSVALKNGCKLATKGEITVEQASGYFAFTLPHITYTDSKGVRSEIGMVAINAVPQANNEWKISLALPTPINSYGSGGAEQFRTDIGSQNASGVWNEKLGHFTSVDADYSNIRLSNLQDQGTVTIGALSVDSRMQENDPDVYTGKAIVTADNISIFDAATRFNGSIPKIRLDGNIADRASKTPMTKEQVKNRPQSNYPDFFNLFAFMFGAPEHVNATVTGLNSLNAQLQASMVTATPDIRAKLLQAILGVSAVSGMGKPVSGDATSKSYDVVFGANGNVTVNGTDLGALMNTTAQPAAGVPVLR